MELKDSKTAENLKQAFAAESQDAIRFRYFAEQADKEGHREAAEAFNAIAEDAASHARGHLESLEKCGDPATGEPIGNTADNLAAAVAGEASDHAEFYPAMVRTAREEGLDDIAGWFETLAKAEKSHAGKFKRTLETLKDEG